MADLGADPAMLVHVGVTFAFGRAGAAEGDTGRELCFQQLSVADLVGARHDSTGRRADRRAIEVEPNAGDQFVDIGLCEAGIGAGGAGFHAGEAGIDAAADGFSMARPVRMSFDHCANGYG